MKTIETLLIGGILLATASTACADHKLLITDVVGAKGAEVQTGYEYSSLRPTIVGGRKYSKIDSAFVTTGAVGIGHGFQLDLSLRQELHNQDLEPSGVADHSGAGRVSTGFRYRFNCSQNPQLALLTGIGFTFAGEGHNPVTGDGSTDVSPFVAASYQMGSGYTPYALYRANLREKKWAGNSHEVALGVDKELSKTVTLGIKGAVAFGTGSPESSTTEDASFELNSYLRVAKNFYLIPSVAALQQSRRTIGDIRQQSVAGIKTGLALYYYFGGTPAAVKNIAPAPEPVVAVVAVVPAPKLVARVTELAVAPKPKVVAVSPAAVVVKIVAASASSPAVITEFAPVAVVATSTSAKSGRDYCANPATVVIEFGGSKTSVKAEYYKQLDKLGRFLKENRSAKGKIEGYSAHGTAAGMMKLSQARAESVRDYIVTTFGIDCSRLSAIGYGQAHPIASNKTAAGRRKNFRMIAVITCE
jgi:outer membrane protein OmpA-like peptidoglycan-associated protein